MQLSCASYYLSCNSLVHVCFNLDKRSVWYLGSVAGSDATNYATYLKLLLCITVPRDDTTLPTKYLCSSKIEEKEQKNGRVATINGARLLFPDAPNVKSFNVIYVDTILHDINRKFDISFNYNS